MANRELQKYLALFAAFLLAGSALVYTVVYFPMYRELQQGTLEKFALVASARYDRFEVFVDDCVAQGMELADNPDIRSAVAGYRSGIIDLKSLRVYSDTVYRTVSEEMEGLIGSALLFDGEVLASWGNIDAIPVPESVPDRSETRVVPVPSGEEDLLAVFNPVPEPRDGSGWSIAVFGSREILDTLRTDGYEIRIADAAGAQQVVFRSHEQHVYDDIRIRHDGDGTCVLLPILFSESYFHVRMDDHPLYSEVRRLSGWVSSWTGAGSALTVTLLIILVTRNYRRVIRRISTSEKRYKELAYLDPLTGAYTRHYLNVWRSGLPRRFDAPWSLVIIDADDFKMINDRYDHSTGDRVLAAIARMVQRSIREEDLLIRFGGDEFLVCMRSCTRERAEAAMRRISADIAGDRSFPFRISVSFGVAEIRTPDEYATGISEADKRMYEMKNARKGTAGTP